MLTPHRKDVSCYEPLTKASDSDCSFDFQEVGCGVMDWSDLAQDRDRWRTLVYAVMNVCFL